MLTQLNRLFRRQEGVAAVEFALIAMPFFLLLIGTIEMALFFAAGTVLEGGSAAASRLIRTGQAQLSGDPETMFRDALCNHVDAMLDCTKIQYEVIHVSEGTFGAAETYEPEFDEDGNLVPADFSTGNSNDVVMVRTVYRYEFLTPFIGSLMSAGSANNSMMHMSMSVLKAEPYTFGEE